MKILRLRHVGYVVKNETEFNSMVSYYSDLGYKDYNPPHYEIWLGNRLLILKMAHEKSKEVIEIVMGNWKNHICYEVSEMPKKLLFAKITKDIEVGFLQDPMGNYIEVVKFNIK